MRSFSPLFPTSGRVSEERQIGRAETIERLCGRVSRGHHALLFGDRRIGKSSVAAATIARVRAVGDLGIDIDFSAEITNDRALVSSLLRQARDQDVGGETSVKRVREALRAGAEKARRLVGLGAGLGIDEVAGIDRILDLLARAEETDDLRHALAAIVADSLVTDRKVVILLDEVQHVADWPGSAAVEHDLAAAMRHGGGPSFIFAGSERRPLDKMFAAGRPLYAEGLWFDLPRIADQDWQTGLLERFREGNVGIDASMIRQVLAISDSHPQDTMRICAHAYEWALQSSARAVDTLALKQAHLEARRHPSWGAR